VSFPRGFSLALALVVAVLLPAPARAAVEVQVPRNDGWVTDLAGLLDDAQERQLEALMESYKRGAGHEIALLTVPDLGGEPIERFALEVGRSWGIGGKDEHNGALLVVSRDDRKLRIEVGRGLEGGLTDAISGRIIREVIAPEFRRGDFPGGLRSGVLAMHAAIGGDYAPIESSRGGRHGRRAAGGGAVFLFFLFVLLFLGRLGRGRGGRGGGMGIWPWLWLASSVSHRGGSFHGGVGGGGFGGGGFSGFGGGGGFSGGGASGGW